MNAGEENGSQSSLYALHNLSGFGAGCYWYFLNFNLDFDPPLQSFPGHLPQQPIIINKSPKQVWKVLEIFWHKTTWEWSMAQDDELCLWKGLGMKDNPQKYIQKYLNVQSWGGTVFQFFIFPPVKD